ncbi:MAG: hypothetical protein ABGX98_01080, partial [Pseudomonadota bacterium]
MNRSNSNRALHVLYQFGRVLCFFSKLSLKTSTHGPNPPHIQPTTEASIPRRRTTRGSNQRQLSTTDILAP